MADKFLIYKSSGGLAHSLGGLWRAINVAKNVKRFLIIDFRAHKAFNNNFSEFFIIKDNLKYSDTYDMIPPDYTYKNLTIDDMKKGTLKIIDRGYTILGNRISKNLKENENIQFVAGTSGKKGRVFIKGLRVQPNIMDKLKKEKLIQGKYIAVHYRNTDLKNNLNRKVEILKYLCKHTNINTVFLASDDYYALENFKRELPKINFIRYTIPEKDVHNIHYFSKDKWKQVYECIRDIYMILQANFFVPSENSGLSRMIMQMILQKENMFDLPQKTVTISV